MGGDVGAANEPPHYELIPTMPDLRLRPLIEQFATMRTAQPVFRGMFGAI